MKLTKDTVAGLTLPPGKNDFIAWCSSMPGFGVRLRGSTKTYVVQYRVGVQQRRETLGDVRKVAIEDARKAARQRFAKVELGMDPGAEREDAAAGRLTLGVAADRYIEAREAMRRPSTMKAIRLHLRVHWAPLRSRPLAAITRADVAAQLQALVKERGRAAAAAARRNLSAMFLWAAKEGLCASNIVTLTNDPNEGKKSRDRVLDDAEIRAVWRACEGSAFGRIVRLLLLTGCRREEIGGLRWDEVNFETAVMSIVGSRTKNHRALVLTLPPAALDILRAIPRGEGQDFVFGTRKNGPFAGWGFAKVALDNRIAQTSGKMLAPWVFHDLRRTMRSGLGRLGVAPHVAELCIGHTRKGVESIYDRHRYQGEIKAALALWAEHVLAVVDGRKATVVPLQRPA